MLVVPGLSQGNPREGAAEGPPHPPHPRPQSQELPRVFSSGSLKAHGSLSIHKSPDLPARN